MKALLNPLTLLVVIIGCLVSVGCSDDDDAPREEAKIYTLNALPGFNNPGNVIFQKDGSNATLVTIQLEGTEDGAIHPAHIHANSVAEGGPIVVDLTSVDGSTGRSQTRVTMFDNGTPVTYEELITYNGHVNVHLSMEDLATLIAEGNIGSNAPSAPSPPNGTGY
ncbi:hypothetical protein KIH41_04155 [Litoribacter ruber]|uniref:CHRD domain-containing protein n=1 Tax=Litoribacter ruber TaxID=702568 RepID=UPI001BDB2C07|nr:CHRD domain-containing protein [Litoribacter ruber]MBT0810468.1 hypothetical protein [Litoribacter ruber]